MSKHLHRRPLHLIVDLEISMRRAEVLKSAPTGRNANNYHMIVVWAGISGSF